MWDRQCPMASQRELYPSSIAYYNNSKECLKIANFLPALFPKFTFYDNRFRTNNRSFQFSCSLFSDSFWPHGLQHARLPCPSQIPEVCSDSYPSSWWFHPTISSSVIPFFSYNLQHQGLFQWISSLHSVAKVLEIKLQHQSFQWKVRTDFL